MAFHVKNTTFANLLDLLAPLSCLGCGKLGSPLCEKCKNHIIQNHLDICPVCKESKNPKNSQTAQVFKLAEAKIQNSESAKDLKSIAAQNSQTPETLLCKNCPDLPPAFIIGARKTLLGTAIQALKFQSLRPLARDLAEILDATFPPLTGEVIIVPLPTSGKHIRARGLDHTLLIAKHFARLRNKNKNNHYHVEKLLLRAKDTVQVGSDAKTRRAQAASAYALNPKLTPNKNATHLLLDDIWTTGASMFAAYQKLAPFDLKPVLIALALNNPEK